MGPNSTESGAMSRPRRTVVLLVEDDAEIREALTELLEDKGMVPLVVADGVEALAVLRKGVRPAVILLDLMLPRMNGWEFRREQMRDSSLRGIPVIATTAAAVEVGPARAELGNVAWLPKPFKPEVLLETIEAVVGFGPAAHGPKSSTP
jgi:CheY-like chemotaxis protein